MPTSESPGNAPRTFNTLANTPTALAHLAVHFRPGERELATRFFQLLGARIREFPNPLSPEPIYLVAMNGAEPDRASDIIFLMALKPAQAELEEVIASALRIGTAEEHPAVGAFHAHRNEWLESYLHFGLVFDSLDELEASVGRLRSEIEADPVFGARIKDLRVLRARGEDGDEAVAARMDSSAVFAEAEHAYGRNTVQVHIRTDLFATGLAMLDSVVELDFVFTGPGRERNPFNDLTP
ncbi:MULTISPECIES: hypothetical protein [Saccharopolyspora]|uniref:Uncharacterized protein n=1 Tax=Saccharopolyspora flava TaxID=95161 RepID=A0A1I6UF88_9PSEU|nr:MULTISPECIES: hypothetical protein [Saccharopolyspora]SFT00058.1 hypothetical protein SAMN05660874_04869 [Saccharopolyspora flava]